MLTMTTNLGPKTEPKEQPKIYLKLVQLVFKFIFITNQKTAKIYNLHSAFDNLHIISFFWQLFETADTLLT